MNRDCLVKVVLVGFLHVKLHPHLPVHTGWRKVSVRGPHVRSGELCSLPLRKEYLPKLFGHLLQGRLASSPLFINVFTSSKLIYT